MLDAPLQAFSLGLNMRFDWPSICANSNRLNHIFCKQCVEQHCRNDVGSSATREERPVWGAGASRGLFLVFEGDGGGWGLCLRFANRFGLVCWRCVGDL